MGIKKCGKTGLVFMALMIFMPAAYAMDFGGWGEWHEDEKGYEEFQKNKQEHCTKLLNELGLSDEQMRAVEQHRQTREAGKPDLRQRMHEVKKSIRAELDAVETDRVKLEQLIDESSELMKLMMRERVESVLELKAILTPEQFSALQEKKEQMHQERREKWKKLHEKKMEEENQ